MASRDVNAFFVTLAVFAIATVLVVSGAMDWDPIVVKPSKHGLKEIPPALYLGIILQVVGIYFMAFPIVIILFIGSIFGNMPGRDRV